MSAKPAVPVLLTCANAQVGPTVIRMLRDHPDYEIRVVGVGAGEPRDGAGHAFCDYYESVPLGSEVGYVSAIQDLVKRHGVRLIFVGSDEEVLELSRHAEDFRRAGCALACSGYEVNNLASDKYALMKHLESRSVPVDDMRYPSTPEALEQAVHELGFPERGVIIKPRRGRGSRGFYLIRESSGDFEQFARGASHEIELPRLIETFRSHPDKLRDYFLMAYLPGDKYSSDILIAQGKPVAMVTRNNGPVPKTHPPTQTADIVQERDVEAYAERVATSLPFDYFLQVESGRDAEGQLRLIEVNVRLDATLPITEGVGLNFYREMITYAMTGRFREIVVPPAPKCRYLRYWTQVFVD